MPPDCPDGSEGRVCHGAEFCAVDGCISSSECADGDGCVIRELCIETVRCFGGGGGGGTTMTTVTGADCAGCAGRCESHFVCAGGTPRLDAGRPRVDAGRPPVDAGRRDAGRPLDGGPGGREHVTYCGCSVPSRSAAVPHGWLALGAALALALGARRR